MPDLSDTIESVASAPKQTEVDGQRVTEHSLQELIEADRYLQERTAATRDRLPVRFVTLQPPGAV